MNLSDNIKKYSAGSIFIVLIIILFIFQNQTEIIESSLETTIPSVELAGETIIVEIADNSNERATGLMFRESLEDNEGMLFIFPNENKKSFWMKNTLIPLDIIFISSSLEVVDITSLEPCRTDGCPTYTSIDDAIYVLEVNAGFSIKNNLQIGDEIKIT